MPLASTRRPTRLLALLAGLLMAVALGVALRPAEPAAARGTGELDVGGTAYRFRPTICTITETDFLTAGSGEIDGEGFWISASPDSALLSLGSSDPSTVAGSDRVRLTSVGQVRWRLVAGSVDAAVTLRRARDDRAPELAGRLTVDCETV